MSGLADSFREMWKTALTALGQLNTLVPAYWDGALDTALRVVLTALPLFAAVLLVQLGLAWVCWHYGLRFVAGRTRWDYLCALGCYPLTWLCSVPLRRLGAPAAYCARRGAFRRL